MKEFSQVHSDEKSLVENCLSFKNIIRNGTTKIANDGVIRSAEKGNIP